MFTAYKKFWENGLAFNGISSRSDYWNIFLFNFLLQFILCFIGLIVAATTRIVIDTIFVYILVILNVYYMVCFIPSLALTWRRFHDIGYSGAFFFLNFIPVIGTFTFILMMLLPSRLSNNFYRKQLESQTIEQNQPTETTSNNDKITSIAKVFESLNILLKNKIITQKDFDILNKRVVTNFEKENKI